MAFSEETYDMALRVRRIENAQKLMRSDVADILRQLDRIVFLLEYLKGPQP